MDKKQTAGTGQPVDWKSVPTVTNKDKIMAKRINNMDVRLFPRNDGTMGVECIYDDGRRVYPAKPVKNGGTWNGIRFNIGQS